MPTYDFRCPRCDEVFEVRRSFTEEGPVFCRRCGAEARQVFSDFSLFVKGRARQAATDIMERHPRGREYAAMADHAIDRAMQDIKQGSEPKKVSEA